MNYQEKVAAWYYTWGYLIGLSAQLHMIRHRIDRAQVVAALEWLES